jgi:hypothetical protein
VKTNNPGCNCCEGGNCERDCWYGCANGTKPCPNPCGIRISMPTPDSVDQADGVSCPPSECTISAPCNACLALFDHVFGFAGGSREPPIGDCDNYTIGFVPKISQGGDAGVFLIPCWDSTNYNCPYDQNFTEQCGAEYYLDTPRVFWNVARVDGCAVTTITIKYTVVQQCDLVGIPPAPPTLPATTYEHKYVRTHCDCDDVYGVVPFSETVSTNNSRGITVPDPCNGDSATVELLGEQDCGVCPCFDCEDVETIALEMSGSFFTGTVVLSYSPNFQNVQDLCAYTGQFTVNCGGPSDEVAVATIFMLCEPCEKYSLSLVVEVLTDNAFENYRVLVWQGILYDIGCGEGGTFTGYKTGFKCSANLDGQTFSVSAL